MFSKQQNSLLLFLLVLTLAQLELAFCSNYNSLSETKKSPGWIGTSMGRRLKRNPKEDVGSGTMFFSQNRDDLNALAELIQENPWTVFANVPEGQKRQMNFTPRLGRDAGEENIPIISNAERWLPDSELVVASSDMTVRSPQFSPRLGRRTGNPFGLQFGRYA